MKELKRGHSMKKLRKNFRMIICWTLVSLMLQIPAYYFLNRQIEKVMAPSEKEAVVRTLKTNIPGTSFNNTQISYAKDYLAYEEDGVLKVYNLEQGKQVFSKAPPSNDKDLGVLYFQWLPDRNTLIYFYARKNPNPVTTKVVPDTSQGASKSSKPEGSSTSGTAHTQSTAPTQAADPNASKTEDPNQAPKQASPGGSSSTPQQQRVVTIYNNPQITDLYTLELPDSDDTITPPDDRFNESIDSFPAGGKITNMVVSTFTNLIYLTIKSGTNLQLMEIDVMKNVRTLNRSGEVITKIVASDKFGTLYIESKTGKTKTIQALDGTSRHNISSDQNETILGNRDGILYLGKVQDDNLVEIRSAAENSDSTNLDFKTVWQGSIPFKDAKIVIGVKDQIVINSGQTAYIIQSNGQQEQVELSGKENIISQDGAELIELTPNDKSTDVELKPLSNS